MITPRTFTGDEVEAINALTDELAGHFTTVESEDFADAVGRAAQSLPLSLRLLAYEHRLGKGERCLLLKGLVIADDQLMPTPASWDNSWSEPRILKIEIRHALVASLFGDIFGWHTQENGRYFRHVIPHRKDEGEQLGSGSSVDLEWHNEEAFHPSRADLIALNCYRNHERAVTTVCTASSLELSRQTKEILRQPRFVIVPDKSHRPDFNKSTQWVLSAADFSRIEKMLNNPEPDAILAGPDHDPFIRIDPAFMYAIDPEAEAALNEIKAEVDKKQLDVVLESGDFLIIDNLRAVHGRRKYKPEYGPAQRWMRRVNIAADLAKSGKNIWVGNRRRFC
jgi:Fe(II)/alpha-ketoglutarate-dependent arginine beta-hydroxylase